MGLRAWRARRAATRAQAEAAAAESAWQAAQREAVRRWDQASKELDGFIQLAPTSGYKPEDVADLTVVLHDGESWLGAWTASLVEPRVGASHSVTDWGGFTYSLTDNSTVRGGQARTTHTPGVEAATTIDTGNLVATSRRLIFQGGKRAHEWHYDKLIGYINYDDEPITSIQVSNRERVSAARYDWSDESDFRFRFAWGLALSQNDLPAFAQHLEEQRQALGPRPLTEGLTSESV